MSLGAPGDASREDGSPPRGRGRTRRNIRHGFIRAWRGLFTARVTVPAATLERGPAGDALL